MGKHPMTEKEAWLAFLSSDDPQVVTRQIEGGRNGGLFSQILPA